MFYVYLFQHVIPQGQSVVGHGLAFYSVIVFFFQKRKTKCSNLPRKVPLKSKSHFSTVQTVKRVQISSIDTAFWPFFSFGLIIPDTQLRLTVHRITVSSCQLCHVSSFGSDWSWHPRCVIPIALSPSSAEKKSKVVVQYWTKERLLKKDLIVVAEERLPVERFLPSSTKSGYTKIN